MIADTKRASFVLLPEGEDPDSLIRKGGPAAFERELARALPLSQYFLSTLSTGRSMRSAEDRAAAVAEARPLLLSMAPGAMRLQLLRELADATRTGIEDLESLFGLRRARASRPVAMQARTRHADVSDLKRRILMQLLVHPALARDFSDAIVDEHVERTEPIDQAIVEVWRAAMESSASVAVSHGVLLEILADSPHAGEYRALAAQEMELETDASTASTLLAGAFHKLRLQRLEGERNARLSDYEREPTADHLDAYRRADLAYTRARGGEPQGDERRAEV